MHPMKDKIVLGIDIGGSHISAGLVNLETRSLMTETLLRKRVNAKGTIEEILGLWKTTIQAVIMEEPSFSGKKGIAIPGPFDYDNGISLMRNQEKYDALYGLNVKQLLAEQLQTQVESIRMMNDARCFLQGEVFAGVARGCKRALGLTLGTGLGSARYGSGVAEDADLWQSSFKQGIAEDYLSSRWFIQRFQELAGKEVEGVKDLVRQASEDRLAKQVFDEFGKNLAVFLHPLLLAEKPEVVVLGGNIARAFGLFASSLENTLEQLKVNSCIRVSCLGEQATLIGAASSWDVDGGDA